MLEGFSDVELAVIFGSVARRQATRMSDVDVGVKWTSESIKARRRLEVALGRAAKCPVDLVSLEASPPLLRFEIARDGKVLLERRPYAWADFRARAMVDWWDWAPWARRIHAAAAARLKRKVGHGSA